MRMNALITVEKAAWTFTVTPLNKSSYLYMISIGGALSQGLWHVLL